MFTYKRLRRIGKTRAPRFHGNGFVQVYLSPRKRLDIWHPDLPAIPTAGGVHDHRFSFTSTILLGKLQHDIYAVESADTDDPALFRVDCGQPAPGPFTFSTAPPVCLGGCRATLLGSFTFPRGVSYSFERGKFHETKTPSGLITMTLLTKVDEDPNHHSRVVRARADGPLGHAFAHDVSMPRIWRAIEDACAELRKVESLDERDDVSS